MVYAGAEIRDEFKAVARLLEEFRIEIVSERRRQNVMIRGQRDERRPGKLPAVDVKRRIEQGRQSFLDDVRQLSGNGDLKGARRLRLAGHLARAFLWRIVERG